MSNNIIDKIQLSGVTYDIGGQGGSGVSVVEVTQVEYDALPSSAKTDTSKMYVITDAQAGDLTNYYTKTETNTLLGGKADTATTYTKTEVDNAITAATSTKQDTLVSSVNIKSINNTSILGSGNIDIQGGGGGISSAECQTMINNSISGKADSDDVYTTGQTSGATELATAFAATQPKLSAGTGISIDANNVISATGGGGGGSYTPGDGIDITNNVISVTGKVDTTTYSAYTANTTAVLFGLDNKMIDIEPKVNSAWTKGVRDLLWYPTSSGLTLEYNIMSGGTYQFAVQPMDESLRYGENAGGVRRYLGVYASGNTYNLLVNKYNNTAGGYWITFPMAYKASKVTLQLNSAYTGQTPTTNAIQAYYYDNNGVDYNPKWNYNSGTDSFTNSTEYTGITLAYDQITKIVTLTIDSSYNYIRGVRTAKNFADENDLTNPSYYIGAVTIETNSYKLQEVLDSKQDTLIAGENITISGNVISATGGGGGGGKAIEAGRGISITTGETADTVSFDLPIYSGGNNSIQIGNSGNTLNGYYNLIVGQRNRVTYSGDGNILVGSNNITDMNNFCALFGQYNRVDSAKEECFVAGNNNHVYNSIETAFGQYCNSYRNSYSFGDSGNTLFSVGNGTADNARHNAFEIRQNGDIYITSGGTDIKLQDNLGGGGSITIDPSLDSGSTNPVANSAITQNFYNYAKFIGNAKNGYGVDVSFNEGTGNYMGINLSKLKTTANGTSQNSTTSWCRISTINGKKVFSTNAANVSDFSLVETSAITTAITSSSTDAQVPSAKAVYDQVGGLKLVKLTQSAYDALSPNYDSNTLYVIVN